MAIAVGRRDQAAELRTATDAHPREIADPSREHQDPRQPRRSRASTSPVTGRPSSRPRVITDYNENARGRDRRDARRRQDPPLLAVRLVHQRLHDQRDRAALQSALLDLPDPHGHGSSELLRDKDIIWQCVSCHKCTHICPRDVEPEGVMKATAHWLDAEGLHAGIALAHLRRGVHATRSSSAAGSRTPRSCTNSCARPASR